ncbi:endonuclease/exonuclease/phosphatase family protein [Zobellia roscoffensis]|uniref:endonuclease/exonuclease/phosphatase family protein n=1 Tax=Zobellia roscoffensis TaxID=2779508 RepID=UPI001D04012A|nr:endonuclease/exonuclease/phosphatase family protein [Zobellia roscoffensis]
MNLFKTAHITNNHLRKIVIWAFFSMTNACIGGILLCSSVVFSQNNVHLNKVSLPHKIITANVRVALKTDEERGVGWSNRKHTLFEVLKNHAPDIICFQEVLSVQNSDLKKAFPEYTSLGFEGPEMDMFTDGEYHGIAKNPIFFSKKRYEFISSGCYWLSERPELGGSKAWGTARARHVNWVRLLDRKDSVQFRVLNTHLDHISFQARERQVRMINEESGQYPSNFPQLLSGDFNSDIDSREINEVQLDWSDSYSDVHGKIDPGYTMHNFVGPNRKIPIEHKVKGKIDFIFYRGDIKASSAQIIKEKVNGIYPSDHYFVSAELLIK